MRGASALDGWLNSHPDTAGFVVWEPVLASDEAPPASGKRVPLAKNYWDAQLARSTAMMKSGADPKCLAQGDADVGVVWDAVFDYAPGSDAPKFCGRTVLEALPSLPR